MSAEWRGPEWNQQKRTKRRQLQGYSAFITPVGKDAMNSWVTQTLRATFSDQQWELIPSSMVHREQAQKQGLALCSHFKTEQSSVRTVPRGNAP